MKRISFVLILCCAAFGIESAAQSPIGTWKALLNYNQAIDVDRLDDVVYVATSSAIFTYNVRDNSVETLNKVNGLTDIGIEMLKAVPESKTLIVGYENGNIDLVVGREIRNFPDIRNSSVQGNKAVRHASIGPQYIYLSTGLGILTFDLERREIRNTYGIVPEGNLQVNQTALLGNTLFAATDQGLYFGDINTDLTIFNNWQIDLGLPDPFGNVRDVATSSNRVYVNQNQAAQAGMYTREEGGMWQQAISTQDIRHLRTVSDGMLVVTSNVVQKRSGDGMSIDFTLDSYDGSPIRSARAHFDEEGNLWVADLAEGLVRRNPSEQFEFITPDGPGTNRCFSLHFSEATDELWVASGGAFHPGVWNNQLRLDGFYGLIDGRWKNYTRFNLPFLEENSFLDVIDIYRYPDEEEEHLLVSSWISGVAEFKNGQAIALYTDENSSLDPWVEYVRPDGKSWVGAIGFDPDDDGNVWMLNARTETPLSVYRGDGDWQGFSLLNTVPTNRPAIDMISTRDNYRWIAVNREGIVVFDPNLPQAAGNPRTIRAGEGSGGLPSNEVYCMVEDLDGAIWVGTSDGISVFFSPFDIFSDNPGEARPILVQQDGIFQPLFENQSISVIRVDGANRKWVGTFGSGLFLMSSDGTEQIANFTQSNSPLLSNRINDIALDPRSGDVYIATQEGLMVYTSDASRGQFSNACTSVYPNPVRENYHGPISITGLMRDTEVRITDVRGNLIASTVSNGGTAVWDGRNQNRERVATGVYFALSSDSEGGSTCVSKILVIK